MYRVQVKLILNPLQSAGMLRLRGFLFAFEGISQSHHNQNVVIKIKHGSTIRGNFSATELGMDFAAFIAGIFDYFRVANCYGKTSFYYQYNQLICNLNKNILPLLFTDFRIKTVFSRPSA
jgi:hypothetical protein